MRLAASTDDPDDVLTRSTVLPSVQYVPTPAPAPPPVLGTVNLQQPIVPGDPAVTTQSPPQALGFRLLWAPPAAGGGIVAPWPTDLGAVPQSEVSAFVLERRRVDTARSSRSAGKSAHLVFRQPRRAHRSPDTLLCDTLVLGFACAYKDLGSHRGLVSC